MSLKLYELTAEFATILSTIEDQGVSPEVEEQLDAVAAAWVDKARAVAIYIREQEALDRELALEQDRIQALRNAAQRNVDGLKGYLARNLRALDLPDNKVDAGLFKIALRLNPWSVEVVDQRAVPQEFLRYKPEPEPEVDKVAALRAWKAAASPDGAAPVDMIGGLRFKREEKLEIK